MTHDIVEARSFAHSKDEKLRYLRYEIEGKENSATVANTDDLLKKQSERNDQNVRELNQVLAENCELKGEIEDLKEQHKEEVDSLKTDLAAKSHDVFVLTDSRDRWQAECTQMIDRLHNKMSIADVDEATHDVWKVANEDNKILATEVKRLTEKLDECDQSRREGNSWRRKLERDLADTREENRILLQDRSHSKVELDGLKFRMENHTPGCTEIIEELNDRIATLENQARTHDKIMMRKANKGAQMQLEDKADLLDHQRRNTEHWRQKYENLRIRCITQKRDLAYGEYYQEDCREQEEEWKVRAFTAEGELQTLRERIDSSGEGLADPRKWAHWQKCAEWRTRAKVVVEDHEKKVQRVVAKYEKKGHGFKELLKGLWERMLDCEALLETYGIEDPDDYLGQTKRQEIKALVEEIFDFDADSEYYGQLKPPERREEGHVEDSDFDPDEDSDVDSDEESAEHDDTGLGARRPETLDHAMEGASCTDPHQLHDSAKGLSLQAEAAQDNKDETARNIQSRDAHKLSPAPLFSLDPKRFQSQHREAGPNAPDGGCARGPGQFESTQAEEKQDALYEGDISFTSIEEEMIR